MCIYDPLDACGESFSKRQDLIALIKGLPPLQEPRDAFHTVLVADDNEVLREIARNMEKRIVEHMQKEEFEHVGISLGDLDKIEMIDNPFVTRLMSVCVLCVYVHGGEDKETIPHVNGVCKYVLASVYVCMDGCMYICIHAQMIV